MKLDNLNIQSLPGIEPGFALNGIDTGVNVVTGPNGIGKSSLIRALRFLIGGADASDPTALSLSAEFTNGGRWRVRRAGSEIAWTYDRQAAEPPSLPGRDQLHCYWLSMEDLLQADKRDERLVAELHRALAGGYDLKALRNASVFNVAPRVGQTEERRLQELQKSSRQVENDYEALRRDEARLPGLETEIEAARHARVRAEQLDKALSLLEVCQQRREVEARLATFPPNMARLRGDELDRLGRLEKQREDLKNQHETARRQQAEAETALQETGLTDKRPEATALEAEKRRLETVRRNEDMLSDRREQLEREQAREAQALTALGNQGELPQITETHVSEAEALANRLKTKQSEIDELEGRLAEAKQAPTEQAIHHHRLAIDALQSWLTAEASQDQRMIGALLLTMFGALVAAGMGIVAGAWGAAGGGLVAVAGVVWAWLSRGDHKQQARQRFSKTGLDEPAAWQRDSVQQRLEAIDQSHVRLLRTCELVVEADEYQRRLERAREALEALETERSHMAERLGFDPNLTAVGLDHFVRRVNEYQIAAAARKSQQAEVQRVCKETDQLLGQVKAYLEQWQVVSDSSLEGLTATLSALEERVAAAEQAERQLADATREAQRLDKALAGNDAEQERLYGEAGLTAGDRRGLEDCCARLEDWQQEREALHAAQAREAEKRQGLAEAAELLSVVDSEDRESLERERDQAQSAAARLEELQDARTTIQTRLEDAGKDRELEKVQADREAALDALRDRRDEALFADASQFLLNAVEDEHRSENEPEVLRDARERFRRFTHYEWDLSLEGEAGFAARDLRQGSKRSLYELSSGTRMQLLLAVRLAWTQHIEHGRESLPLFLDEALTTADESRFKVVAESLEQIANDEGRQIFYLGARRHEAALWEQMTGRSVCHVDLAAVRFSDHVASAEALVLPEHKPLPSPDDKSAEGYAVDLGVPSVDPQGPEGGLHIFHLLRDELPLLHHLMEDWQVSTLGQLETLLDSTAARFAIPDAPMRERLAGRCAVARIWIAAWRQGRGQYVDRSVLEQSEAVTSNFIDRVAELAEELDGDGEQIIAALREGQINRFRTNSIDELEEWLQTEGYIDTDESLSTDDRERQTLISAAATTEASEAKEVVGWMEAGLTGVSN